MKTIRSDSEDRRREWRAGRAPYQKKVVLNTRHFLDILRLHPGCTNEEFKKHSNDWGISNIPEKYMVKSKRPDGQWTYRAATLDEVIAREEKKQAEREQNVVRERIKDPIDL